MLHLTIYKITMNDNDSADDKAIIGVKNPSTRTTSTIDHREILALKRRNF
jgi:hypothetical protein